MGADRLSRRRTATLGATTAVALAISGCGASRPATRARRSPPAPATAIPRALADEARPIGRGPAFHPPARGPVIGPCRPGLGARDGAHVELFAADRVVLVAPGIGARPPLHRENGRIVAARCFGTLVTVDPTGVVLVRPGAHPTIGDLMRSWGETLDAHRLLSFRGPVSAYVGGRRWTSTAPASIPLARHAEIVLEVGPHVPPHPAFTFPPGT